MSKNFNNIDPSRETGLILKGWSLTQPYDNNRIAKIQDTVGAGIAISKMGTSIPTPLARLYLFDTAFAQYNHYGSNAGSLYDRLISECLDMIEFIYHYGDEIEVKDWNVSQNIALLKNSSREGHQRLGNNLEQFLVDLDVDNIYMFYYNGILIGGTSPYTLVFTSPNWQRRFDEACLVMQGTGGNRLFPNYAATNTPTIHLKHRHADIREYLTKLIAAFHNDKRFSQTAFWEYVRKSDENAYVRLTGLKEYNESNFRNEYSFLTCGTDINIYGAGRTERIIIGYKKTAFTQTDADGNEIASPNPADDYEIDSPKCPDGAPRPNMLNDFGLSMGKYIGGKPWHPANVLVKNPQQPLSERTMPGPGNVKYPFLTEADFLEDQLLRLPYKVSSTDFVTFGLDNYLLPLKPRFFEYFNISDINNKDSRLSFRMEMVGQDVKVTLVVPVKCKGENTLTIEKTYKGEDVVTVNAFSLALFPSYRIKEGNTIPNVYALMCFDQNKKAKTVCFSIKNSEVSPLIPEPEQGVRRNSDNVINTIKGDLYFVQVTYDDRHALAIPNLKEVSPVQTTAVVGIDFGTTNTYVCLNNDERNARPVPLEIKNNNRQVLTLNAIDLSRGLRDSKFSNSFVSVLPMQRALNREFAPLVLGEDSKCEVELPFRTVTCENPEFVNRQDANLFGHINIGYNFLNEKFETSGFEYVTDIKWALRGNPNDATIRKNRLEAFCLQTAWMVKNQIMLSYNPSINVKIIVTFPYNMGSLATRIMSSWRNAFREVFGDAAILEKKTESETPFYYLIGIKQEKIEQNMLNVDVGGATTDMLFADVEKKRLLYNSTLFAGNDIWGDGLSLTTVNPGQNGYVLKFESMLKNSSSIENSHIDEYYDYKKGVKKVSSDLMSYIFRFNKRYDYESTLISDKQLRAPLFLHLGALVYHIAQILKAKEISVPTTINFSGMGSNYIKLISTDEDQITNLIRGLLAGFMGYGFDDKEKMPKGFKVKFEDNPKIVTAQGAVISQHDNVKAFDEYDREEMFVYGFNDSPEYITYGNVSNYRKKLLDEYYKFLDIFVGNPDEKDENVKQSQASVKRLLKPFDFKFPEKTYSILVDAAGTSFENMVIKDNPDKTDTIEETLFFWPLKNGLYRVSKGE